MKKRYSPTKITAFMGTFFYLLKNLNSIKFYFQYCLSNNSPLESELPWIAFDAIKYLDKRILPGDQVFEYGSGGSTLYFAKKVNRTC